MDGIKLTRIALLALVGTGFLTPASARTSDAPMFGVWLEQWSQHAQQPGITRLPCLKTDKAACTSAFPPAETARENASRKGREESARGAAAAGSTHRQQVVFKRVKRVYAHKHLAELGADDDALLISGGVTLQNVNFLTGGQDGGGWREFHKLGGLIDDFEPPVAGNDPLLSSAAAGIGNNAFGALYDFEDQGVPGESQRDFPEIASLGVQGTQLVAAAVPEPGALALVGAGLLILRLQTRRAARRTPPLSPA